MNKLLSALILSAFGVAQAASVSFSDSHGPSLTDWDPAETLQLQKFDPSQGTLNSVTFEFEGRLASLFTATSTSLRGRQLSSVLGGTMAFMLPTNTSYTLSLSDSDSLLLARGVIYSKTLQDSITRTETLTTDLSPFVGVGHFDLGVLALATSQITASGNGTSSVETNAYASARVTYGYSPAAAPAQPVPEPGSLLLVGLALGAAGLSRRRQT